MATTEALIGALQLQIGALAEELERLSSGAARRVRDRAIELGRKQGDTAAADFLENNRSQNDAISTLNVEG